MLDNIRIVEKRNRKYVGKWKQEASISIAACYFCLEM